MTPLREAAQQALEALEYDGLLKKWQAITALKAALAEPVQEPVAWLFTNLQSGDYDFCYQEDEHDHDREMWHKQPLYAAPPQRKPLTDDQLDDIVVAARRGNLYDLRIAIERANGIGGDE